MFGVSGRYILGFLWVLPVSILGWIFFGLAALFGAFEEFKVTKELFFVWDLNENSKFFQKLFKERGWAGFSMGNNIILVEYSKEDRYQRTFKHEKEHGFQQYRWGVAFFIVYLFYSVMVYLMNRHGYLDNPFEIEAREAAGQQVYIPRSEWPDGPNDRWSWW